VWGWLVVAVLIDIEGVDGAGKGTQSRRLVERIRASGRSCALVGFPRYDATWFGRAVGRFLNGAFGQLDDVHPFLVSLLFAGDRFESREELARALATHDVVVLDRYVASNKAHQGAKASGPERLELVAAIDHLEHGLYGLPRPDRVILLDLAVSTAQELVGRKAARSYTEKAADLQEADGPYLEKVASLYRELAAGDASWRVVGCEQAGALRDIECIGDEIWRLASELLPGAAS
jgi:dTMP kinase